MAASSRRNAGNDVKASGRRPLLWATVVFITACLTCGLVWLYRGDAKPGTDYREKAFARLVETRDVKKQEVIAHLRNVQRLARAIKDDPVMLQSFRTMNRPGYAPDEALEYMVDRQWVSRYDDFYDVLFVNTEGMVFHSVRKESDYQTNLFTGPLAGTRLAQQMKENPAGDFVDYEFYSPSAEPAAFFATPVHEEGTHVGWFALQCPINRINTILTNRRLGRTGEVYLVNKEKWMLTDSRFVEDCTTLRLKVDTWAVREALERGVGTRVIEDYRGVKVLSAFERFDVFGTSWMVISEIDEDEVLTDHYAKHPGYFNERIFAGSAGAWPTGSPRVLPDRERVRVDLNEYAKAEAGQRLETYGVATCTAVAVVCPERFAYLAHIGPDDSIYASGRRAGPAADGAKSDFLGELIGRIQYYDIYPYELKKLEFTIVAPHDSSFGNIVERLVECGIGLGNIKLICSPGSGYANVVVDPAENLVAVVWDGGIEGDASALVDAARVEDLGAIVRRLAAEEAT